MTGSAPPGWTTGKADQWAIQTHLKRKYLTAMGGGGRITDVIHTSAVKPLNWETFTLWHDSAGITRFRRSTASSSLRSMRVA